MKIKKIRQLLVAVLSVVMLSASVVTVASANDSISSDELVNEKNGKVEETGDRVLPPKDQMGYIDTGWMGSISIQLTDGKPGTVKSAVWFYCTKVADVVNGEYVLVEECSGADVDLNAIENSETLLESARKLAEYKIEGKSDVTDAEGGVKFQNLEVGVYLIQAGETETFDTISPTLVSIPTWDEKNGNMEYDLHLEPKHTPKVDVKEEQNIAPQTGLEDNTLLYVAVGGVCLFGAFVLFLIARRGRQHEK